MTSSSADGDHARPDVSAQRAVLAVARALLAADPGAAHQAAQAGTCPACTVVSAVQFGFTLAAEFGGYQLVTGPLRDRLLAVIEGAQHELGAAPN
jgi:hypothetical protein